MIGSELMREVYYLNEEKLPTIPVPHDCVIDKITLENDYIIFMFEKDISYHDSVKHIKPDVRALVIKIHLVDEGFWLYRWHKPVKGIAENGFFENLDETELFKLTKLCKKVEYCYHYLAYQSIIIELYAETQVRLELTADYVEFDWK